MRVTNRQVLEKAIDEIEGDFTTEECCQKVFEIAPACALTHQQVSHNLLDIPGISIKGKIFKRYWHGGRLVTLYTKD